MEIPLENLWSHYYTINRFSCFYTGKCGTVLQQTYIDDRGYMVFIIKYSNVKIKESNVNNT